MYIIGKQGTQQNRTDWEMCPTYHTLRDLHYGWEFKQEHCIWELLLEEHLQSKWF